MGGDRDGNPNVTHKITQEVLWLSRWQAADLYLRDIENLRWELSIQHCSDELAQELRRRGVAVIMATGYGHIASDRDLVVVSKPYDENMIAAAFRSVMKGQCLDSE